MLRLFALTMSAVGLFLNLILLKSILSLVGSVTTATSMSRILKILSLMYRS
jgi:hypothetical protein